MPESGKSDPRAGYTSPAIPSDIDTAVFVGNVHIDNLHSAFMALAAEVWSLRRRQKIVEALMEARVPVTHRAIEAYVPTAAQETSWRQDRDGFIRSVYDPFLRRDGISYHQSLHSPDGARLMAAFDRRTVLKGAAASAATAGPIARVEAAQAVAGDRGMLGGYHRLPSVDAESRLDFLWGLEAYDAAVQAPAADARALALLASRGIAPAAPVETADAVALFGPDDTISVRLKTFLEAQRMKIRVVGAALARDEAGHVAALDAAMTRGPGTLSLDPGLDVPEYARHSLHMQPGGYVGDPLAGMVFRHAIVGLASGHNFQNEGHSAIAAAVPRPADGRVRRILDLGCGIGQLASALQQHYPDAELWGIDTSAPMLRYAHLRATELGLPLHLAQQSAEAMRFPDAHFDIVTASGLFHEIPATATRAVIAEIARVLRPGGTFYPLDLNTAAPFGTDARSRFAIWLSHRWYHEDWRLDYATLDLAAELARAGLQVGRTPKMGSSAYSRENLMATRPA